MSVSHAAGRATLLMMAFVLLSRVLGVVRDIVIGHLFGQNQLTTVYTASFRIPDILQYLVAGGALATVFVPVFTEYWSTEREEDAWKTFGTVLTLVALIAAALVLLLEIFALPVARVMNPKFSAAAVAETARLSRILLPAQWCFFLGGLMMGTLNARQRFLVPALGPIAYNGGIILGGVLLHRSLGIAAMTWGALAGAFAGNFLLPIWQLRRIGGKFPLGIDLDHPGVRKVGALMLPALLGLSLSQLGFWITGFFLPDDARLSALRNAYNLTQAPIGIFAQASAIVLFPTISALAARQEWAAFRQALHLGIRQILFLTVPASLLMAVLAEPTISAIYLSGHFGPGDVPLAAEALLCYSLGTFAWSAQAVLARGFYAMQNSKTPVQITTTMVVFFVGLCFALPPLFHLDYRGLALALSLAGTLNMAIFLALLQRRVGGLDVRGLARASARIGLAAGVAGGVAWLLLRLLWPGPTTRLAALPALLGAGAAALAVYAGMCLLLRVPEVRTVQAMFRRPAVGRKQVE